MTNPGHMRGCGCTICVVLGPKLAEAIYSGETGLYNSCHDIINHERCANSLFPRGEHGMQSPLHVDRDQWPPAASAVPL